ncbi:OB-fold protein [Bartonella sp. LJL80]
MLKRLMAMVVISGFALSSASAEMSLEEKEFKLINTFVAVQISFSKNKDSNFVFHNLDEVKLPKYTAQAIADEFDENNLAAEKKYKNEALILSGKVLRVSQKTSFIQIVYDTANFRHGNMYAQMNNDFAEVGASLSKGTELSLACRGVYFDGLPEANNCTPVEGGLLVDEQQAMKITKAFLNGENIDKYVTDKKGETQAAALFVKKYAAQFAPDNSPCFSVDTISKCNYADFLPNNGKVSATPEYRKVYIEAKERYHLP